MWHESMQVDVLLAQVPQIRISAQSQRHQPLVSYCGASIRAVALAECFEHELTRGKLHRMRLVHLHVNERHVAYESEVGLLQVAAEYAVVEAGHEEERRQARLDHSHRADKRAEEAVEEEVKVTEYEVELGVLEKHLLLRPAPDEEILAQVPDENALEEEDGQNGQHYLGEILGNEVELDQEAHNDQRDQRHLEQDDVAPEEVADGVAAVVQRARDELGIGETPRRRYVNVLALVGVEHVLLVPPDADKQLNDVDQGGEETGGNDVRAEILVQRLDQLVERVLRVQHEIVVLDRVHFENEAYEQQEQVAAHAHDQL